MKDIQPRPNGGSMVVDLGRLRAFLEVARAGSYQVASRRLHVTPSAISHALRKLQADLGREVIEWRGRRFALTAAGEELFHACQKAFDELEEAERRLGERGAEGGLRVVLGSTTEFGTTVLVQKLGPLLEAHPELRVDHHFTNDLKGLLLRDEVDLAIDCRPHGHPAVHRTQMFREKYAVVAAPAFLARHPVRTPLDLQHVPVLSLDREGQWWTNLLSALPAARRPALTRIVVVDHIRGMINATLAGYGVSLLPKYAVLPELAGGALTVLFPRLRLLEDTFCIYQKVARLSRPGNRLLTEFLVRMDVREFGDAMGRTGGARERPVRPAAR
jgi:DNA-binding transcriptional LysR family regulator